jgi:hypothetical protein
MDKEQRLVLANRSWNALLFLIPAAAQNLIEVLRIARVSIGDDASDEEKALFAQQGAVLSEFYHAMYVMRNGGWAFAHGALQELIADCAELRAKLEREFKDPEFNDPSIQAFRGGMDAQTPAMEDAKAKAERLALPRGGEEISYNVAEEFSDFDDGQAPGSPEGTSSVGESQHGEGK